MSGHKVIYHTVQTQHRLSESSARGEVVGVFEVWARDTAIGNSWLVAKCETRSEADEITKKHKAGKEGER
jgi:hypothetical protein